MAATPSTVAMDPDALVTIKVAIDGAHRRFKVPLSDLGANVLNKLRLLLSIPQGQGVVFERYSDSAASYVLLDEHDPAIFKQLYRAAKAKLKLRIKATRVPLSTNGICNVAEGVDPIPSRIEQPVDEKTKSTVTDENTVPAKDDTVETPATAPAVSESTQAAVAASVHEQPTAASYEQRLASALLSTATKVADTDTDTGRAVDQPEAPVPDLATVRQSLLNVAQSAQARYMALMSARASAGTEVPPPPPASYVVYCNACDRPIQKEYYHCSTCDGGDFDLCGKCVEAGHLCRCDGHWMIKRTIKDGRIISSVTEVARPRPASSVASEASSSVPMPAPPAPASVESTTTTTVVDSPADGPLTIRDIMRRTLECRVCLRPLGPRRLVTCLTCDDYCLCRDCFVGMKHGHDPKHPFSGDTTAGVTLDPVAAALCAPGRNMRHFALCDGCDKTIVGVRHKCLDCPDWDYCSLCIDSAPIIHPGHRFVQVVEPLNSNVKPGPVHFAKLCDGPLCKDNNQYIRGIRYKCAVCHDTDFCANCEASPLNYHNRTHPLIKFKTPVRNVTVCTIGERADGAEMPVMGDYHARNPWSEATPSPATANAATQVQTVVDVEPVQPAKVESNAVDMAASSESSTAEAEPELDAHFVRDTIPDGTVLPPSHVFRQTWTIRNPGPADWPKGCSVKFVGGDNMRNIDPAHPISVAELEKSVESDVLPLDVGTGVNWSFTVTLKTPKRSGKYISYWRLTAPSGVRFGHKLWCEIDVNPHARRTQPAMPPGLGRFAGRQQDVPKLVDDSVEPKEASKNDGRAAKRSEPIDNLLLLRRELQGSIIRARERVQTQANNNNNAVDSTLPLRNRLAPSASVETTRQEESPEQPQAEHIEDVAEEESKDKGKAKMEGSDMIFPTLDKETPVDNQSQASDDKTTTTNKEVEVKEYVQVQEGPAQEDHATSETESELEMQLNLVDESDDEDDAFLTDEEYDVLNASDEEYLDVAQKPTRK